MIGPAALHFTFGEFHTWGLVPALFELRGCHHRLLEGRLAAFTGLPLFSGVDLDADQETGDPHRLLLSC
jgi:hypothetical protein